ncbi:hypothetical protein Tco_0071791 [Tanacetum coccineum]
MQERLDLNKTQGASTPKEVKHMQNVPYASVVGSIMYAVRCTRPDFAFAQNITSWFQQNPGELHWTAMKNILKMRGQWTGKDSKPKYYGNVLLERSCNTIVSSYREADRWRSCLERFRTLILLTKPGVQKRQTYHEEIIILCPKEYCSLVLCQ